MVIFSTLPSINRLAQANAPVDNFPLVYQIACIVLTALFLLTFSIARDPRGWRRLYQSKFADKRRLSVNKNKTIDEAIKKYGIIVAMIILVIDVSCFVFGVTHRYRADQRPLTQEEELQRMDVERFKSGKPAGSLF